MVNLVSENTSRKLDTLGRVVIPKGLRSRYQLEPEDEVQFFTLSEGGQDYIVLSAGKAIDPKYVIAAKALEELGIDVPQALMDKLSNR